MIWPCPILRSPGYGDVKGQFSPHVLSLEEKNSRKSFSTIRGTRVYIEVNVRTYGQISRAMLFGLNTLGINPPMQIH
jgi:hypothetical protein